MAIRENPFRAEAIGYRTVVSPHHRELHCRRHRRRWPGALLALWSSQINPDTTLSFDITVDILLMVVIGGMGTMYGAVIGAVLLVFAQNYPQDLGNRQQGAAGRTAARQPVPPRPLAAVARGGLYPLRLFLPGRNCRPPALEALSRLYSSTLADATARAAGLDVPPQDLVTLGQGGCCAW